MRESANYKFNLPDKADQFNLDHWNQNTEKLDEKLKSIDDLTNNDLKTSLLNFIYPVGSLYWSSNPTNPGTLFGGTWKQIKDCFVLAAGDTYTNGATGGNANTTLTVDNLPSHTHGMNNHTHSFTPTGSVSAHAHGLNNHTHSFSGHASHAHNVLFSSAPFTSFVYWFRGQNNHYVGNSVTTTEGREHIDATGRIITDSQTITISGTTGEASGNTANATPTFTGTAGTTGGASGTTTATGSGTAFSNMPPYIVKYCWERTA